MEESKPNIGANIRHLRKVRGISQAALAKKAQITRVALARIESGDTSPRMSTLQRLASGLGLSLQDIVTPPRLLKYVRFRADGTFDRDSVLIDVAKWLGNYVLVERCAFEHDLDPGPRNVIEDIRQDLALAQRTGSEQRAELAARLARRKADLSNEETVRDVCGLLSERLGVKVYQRPFKTLGFFGLSVKEEDGGPAVVVNTWKQITVERWLFTAIHELGHLVLHESSFDVAQQAETDEEESEATIFAAYFLMPDELFRKEWDDSEGLPLLDRVFKLKRIFKVSYRTVLHRLEDSDYVGADVFDRFDRQFEKRFGVPPSRTTEPDPMSERWFRDGAPEVHRSRERDGLTDTDFVEDRLARLVRKCLGAGEMTLGKAATVLDISLTEMRERAMEWGAYSPATL